MTKIINIGAHKTGTCSLLQSMEILKYKSYSETNWYGNKKWRKEVFEDRNFESILNKIINSDYNFFEDSPFNHNKIYKYIDKNLEDCKFILTIRDKNMWYNSFLRWSKIIPSVNTNNHTLSIYGGYIIEKNRRKIINRYEKRNNEIIDYFKGTGKLCIIHIETSDADKWDILCKFLNKPHPNVKWPHLNKTI